MPMCPVSDMKTPNTPRANNAHNETPMQPPVLQRHVRRRVRRNVGQHIRRNLLHDFNQIDANNAIG